MTPTGPDIAGGQAEALAALMRWYAEVGVDLALGDDPIDRFAETAAEARAAAARQTALQPSTSPSLPVRLPPERPRAEMPAQPIARPEPAQALPGEASPEDARRAAQSAATLDELRAILESFDGCTLKKTARRLVFADGNPEARLMFVGEAPGRDEDEQGLPFVGRSGQLLDLMLKAIGIDRRQCYIANVVPWRPPGNRTPTPQESEICKPFILRQIELVRPDLLVFLGGASASTIAGATEGIRRLRGKWMEPEIGGRKIRALATFHPAYLLRQPLEKRFAWRDFRALQAALTALPPRA